MDQEKESDESQSPKTESDTGLITLRFNWNDLGYINPEYLATILNAVCKPSRHAVSDTPTTVDEAVGTREANTE